MEEEATSGKLIDDLVKACKEGIEDTVKELLEKSISVFPSNEKRLYLLNHKRLLFYAIENNALGIVKALVSAGADINQIHERINTPLSIAVKNGNDDIADFLMASGADVNPTRQSQEPPLVSAVKAGNLNTIRKLLDHGADVDAVAMDGRETSLHIACKWGNVDIVSLLLRKNADVNKRMWYRKTPLHLAVESGHKEIIELLIENRADIEAQDKIGETPMMKAVLSKNLDIVKTLHKHEAQLNYKDSSRPTLLHLATQVNSLEIVQFLLDQNCDVNPPKKCGEHPIANAISQNNYEMTKLLLDRGANIKASWKTAPLLLAVTTSKTIDWINLLIEYGADVQAVTDQSDTCLHLYRGSDVNVVKTLVHAGANVTALNDEGKTCLHELAERISGRGLPEIFDYLLSLKKINVHQKDERGKTILHCAVLNHSEKVIKSLLAFGAEIDVQDHFGDTPLHKTVMGGVENNSTLKFLCEEGANVNTANNDLELPVHLAIKKNNLEGTRILIEFGSDINAEDCLGQNCLSLACYQSSKDIFALLLLHNPALPRNTNLALKVLTFALACTDKSLDILKQFLDTQGTWFNGYHVIHHAASHGSLDVMKYLVEEKCYDIHIKGEVNEATALHLAARNDRFAIMEYLIQKGSQVNSQDANGLTPLSYAVQSQKVSGASIRLFLERGAKIAQEDLEKLAESLFYHMEYDLMKRVFQRADDDGLILQDSLDHLLLCASEKGNLAILQYLLERGANLNARNHTVGSAPLHWAAAQNHLTVVEELISRGANINQETDLGQTPLFLALSYGSEKANCAELLISHGAIIRFSSFCLEFIFQNWNPDVFNNFLKFIPLIPSYQSESGQISEDICALFLGGSRHAERRFIAFKELFFSKLDQQELTKLLTYEKHGMTLFSMACKNNLYQVINLVLECNLSVLNYGSPTPFWQAVSSGDKNLVELLANQDGIDFETPAKDGTTPLMIAIAKGYFDLLAPLGNLYEKKHQDKSIVCLELVRFGKPKGELLNIKEFLPRGKNNTALKQKIFEFAIETDSFKVLVGVQEKLFQKRIRVSNFLFDEKITERSALGVHKFFHIPFLPKDSLLVQVTRNFPVFNDTIEKDWCTTLFNDETLLSDSTSRDDFNLSVLDHYILGTFCSFEKENVSSEENKSLEAVLANMKTLPCKEGCKKQRQCENVNLMLEFCKNLEEEMLSVDKGQLKPQLTLIGSIIEGTRLGFASEMDLTLKFLSLEKLPFSLGKSALELIIHPDAKEKLKDYILGSTNVFDYPKFFADFLMLVQKSMDSVRLPKGLKKAKMRFEPCGECLHITEEAESLYMPMKHCKNCTPGVTHTKAGACVIVIKEGSDEEFLTIDLIPVFKVTGASTLELFNVTIKTLIELRPPFWLNHFNSVIQRDIILHEAHSEVAEDKKDFQYVALKLLHYGPDRNAIIRPGQVMKVDQFHKCPMIKQAYIYIKALKDVLGVKVKSFFIKKVILLPENLSKIEILGKETNKDILNRVIKELLQHPDLKTAFKKRFQQLKKEENQNQSLLKFLENIYYRR